MNNNLKRINNIIKGFPKISALPKLNKLYTPRTLLLLEKKKIMHNLLEPISLLVDHLTILLTKENNELEEKYKYLKNENEIINKSLNDVLSSQKYMENNNLYEEINRIKSLSRLDDRININRENINGLNVEDIMGNEIERYVVNKIVEMDGYKITDEEIKAKENFVKRYA
ncbi:hypothetical protein SLOPH_2561 [Spraguea lophii 42_110]|uniref:Uncharacterized protein n=1 Tax=Spraguea lophii (strain 42_110) TaxID=1358809 RepID=S7XJF6_SPRLO|nr:hypothetical protein SLOPH_2561 [Spraguea lophii 42_110]